MLSDLGLQDDEETVYLALLDRGPAAANDLRDHVLGPRAATRVREALAALVRQLLVSVVDSSAGVYAAIDPELALAGRVEQLEIQAAAARQVVNGLTERHRRVRTGTASEDLVEVVSDLDEALARVAAAMRSTQSELLAMERPPYIEPLTDPNPMEMDLLRKGVSCRVLYEASVLDMPGRMNEIFQGISAGEKARVAPTLPLRALIIDEKQAFLPGNRGGALVDPLVVVRPGPLLDATLAAFEGVWSRAIPLADAAARDVERDARDRLVLDLLSAGFTDEAIARRLEVSPRTVQRWVSDLSTRLGAETRFQTGVQAARQGWL